MNSRDIAITVALVALAIIACLTIIWLTGGLMPLQTQQVQVNATGNSALVLAVGTGVRSFIYIRCYTKSAQGFWISTISPATAGANGELEVLPGAPDYVFGSSVPNRNDLQYLGPCPQEALYVITSGGVATGCIWAFIVT